MFLLLIFVFSFLLGSTSTSTTTTFKNNNNNNESLINISNNNMNSDNHNNNVSVSSNSFSSLTTLQENVRVINFTSSIIKIPHGVSAINDHDGGDDDVTVVVDGEKSVKPPHDDDGLISESTNSHNNSSVGNQTMKSITTEQSWTNTAPGSGSSSEIRSVRNNIEQSSIENSNTITTTIDDYYYSYRDIVENWASAMMKLNSTNRNPNTYFNETASAAASISRLSKRGDRIRTAAAGGNNKRRRSVCRISEFSCARGNKCISSDKYCDTVDDCGDRSDEPASCTPCNRTYYGEWGSTYSLSLSSETIFGHSHGGSSGIGTGGSSSTVGGGGGGNDGQRGSSRGNQFVCQLTFAAAGDDFGDLVQIMFDSINIGQFSSSMIDGCPEGSLQVAEISRPITGGHWCGSGSGLSVYYSEMSAIALTLSIGGGSSGSGSLPRAQQEVPRGVGANPGQISASSSNNSSSILSPSNSQHVQITNEKGDKTVITRVQQPLEFDFKIRYKFIPKSLAVVRYGLYNSPIERGELVPGTYCSRVLDSCHRKRCKIQSPNYPGLYPRNVSCYFTIRQREIPPCKKVLIQVIQLKPHKVQLRSIPTSVGRFGNGAGLVPASTIQDSTASLHDSFLAWEDCTGNRDGLIIYDGTTTDDPVLLKICGGSYIPPITSSGAGLLIAFHSTPFGNPLEPKPPAPYPTPLRGFELDVDVVVVDSLSADYSNHQNCTFYFTSKKTNDMEGVGGGPHDDGFGSYTKYRAQEYGGNWIAGKMGTVKSPRHTLPQNTTCRYEFRGTKHENVWIYFVSYRRVLIKDSKGIDGNCTTRLQIMDGLDSRNEVRLATYCDNELPKLCDHRTLENETRVVRACTADESFISAGSKLIVEQQFLEGTALRHLHYHFNYEFVSRHTGADGTCNRRYHSSKLKPHGTFRTTDNVFDFGRGGRANISCTYTVLLSAYESFHLTVRNSSFGERSCTTAVDAETGRYVCQYNTSSSNFPNKRMSSYPKSEMRLYEYIWPSTNITAHEHCICGNVSGQALIFLGKKIEFAFTVENMKSDESYENFFIEFDYRIVKGGGCRSDNHHELKKHTGGIITLESSFVRGLREKIPTCESYPWLLQGSESHSLYLRIPGFTMLEDGRRNISVGFRNETNLVHHILPERPCPTTKNRIFIYDGENRLVQKICPSSFQLGTSGTSTSGRKLGQTVEIYSDDFHQYNSPLYSTLKSTFVIEFVGRELGSYRVHWLEVMSARMKIAIQTMERDERRMGEAAKAAAGVSSATNGNATILDKKVILEDPLFKSMFENGESISTDPEGGNFVHLVGGTTVAETIAPCPFYCPELNACINEKLWCDGETHCPISEADEKSCDSFWLTVRQLMSPTVYIPIAAAIVSALICCMLVLTCLGLKRLIIIKTTSIQQRRHLHGDRRSPSDARRVPRELLIDPRDPI